MWFFSLLLLIAPALGPEMEARRGFRGEEVVELFVPALEREETFLGGVEAEEETPCKGFDGKVECWTAEGDTDRALAFREGGPTKRDGAGRRCEGVEEGGTLPFCDCEVMACWSL